MAFCSGLKMRKPLCPLPKYLEQSAGTTVKPTASEQSSANDTT